MHAITEELTFDDVHVWVHRDLNDNLLEHIPDHCFKGLSNLFSLSVPHAPCITSMRVYMCQRV